VPCIAAILSCLELAPHLRAGRVCRSWLQAAQTRRSWQGPPARGELLSELPPFQLKSLVERWRYSASELGWLAPKPLLMTAAAAALRPVLEAVTSFKCDYISYGGPDPRKVLPLMPNLTSLLLPSNSFVAAQWRQFPLSRLRHLEVLSVDAGLLTAQARAENGLAALESVEVHSDIGLVPAPVELLSRGGCIMSAQAFAMLPACTRMLECRMTVPLFDALPQLPQLLPLALKAPWTAPLCLEVRSLQNGPARTPQVQVRK
jgi:hypothetical protein